MRITFRQWLWLKTKEKARKFFKWCKTTEFYLFLFIIITAYLLNFEFIRIYIFITWIIVVVVFILWWLHEIYLEEMKKK
ncbi:MAG: hypothetical protein J7K95_05360 [Thermoplasmata archaeon]|nr:hypothetical protein [Thermoplasmata archaeon]